MEIIRIGRENGDVIINNDDKVSRKHCEIIKDDRGNFKLVDYSKNGGENPLFIIMTFIVIDVLLWIFAGVGGFFVHLSPLCILLTAYHVFFCPNH